MRKAGILTLFLLCSAFLFGQDGLRFGISARPILPLDWLDTGPETLSENNLTVTMSPRLGFNFGMFLQQPLSRQIALETGINLVRRNFKSSFVEEASDTSSSVNFAFIGYEIPVQALLFVQLGEDVWMNGSAGFSFDMYPSETFVNTSFFRDTASYEYKVSTLRYNWLKIALVANYGFEYRTKESGSFYLGASYHRPFTAFGRTRSRLEIDGSGTTVEHEMNGSYLTLDLRYIFAENTQRRR